MSAHSPIHDGPYTAILEVPFGVIGIRATDGWITEIDFLPRQTTGLAPQDALSERACREIGRYLDDPAYRFSVPFHAEGTGFQRNVWKRVALIPSGSTSTYASIARGLHTSARPVGAACGSNPVALIIPCHRVIARDGLGGFNHRHRGYFIEIKRWLLRHEGAYIPEISHGLSAAQRAEYRA